MPHLVMNGCCSLVRGGWRGSPEVSDEPTEVLAVDLAAGIARQFPGDDQPPGKLEAGETGTQRLPERVEGQCPGFPGDYDGGHQLTPLRVGRAGDHEVEEGLPPDGEDRVLDLGGVDVLAAALDHVPETPAYVQEPVVVYPAGIAGVKPAVIVR